MKLEKTLPWLTIGLCVPGIALRSLHLLHGFELGSGLPVRGGIWLTVCAAFFVLCAVLFAAAALPLRRCAEVPFERLLGTRSLNFRMSTVVCGLLLLVCGGSYLYLTVITPEQDAAAWAKVLEYVYAAVTLAAGACILGLAKAQGEQMTAGSAKLTLAPLFWSCLHLLVTYRLTCIDPKLPSFAIGLVTDVLLVLACYQLARLLYAKPRPARLGFFAALAATMAISDLGGYGLAYLMGMRAVEWSAKTVLRSGMTVVAGIWLIAQLAVLAQARAEAQAHDN